MAFDGITIANLRWEFAHTIEGGKIAKDRPAGKGRVAYYYKK